MESKERGKLEDIINLSLSARIIINVEALNMAESVGNYVRHRKAPIVMRTENGYSIVYVPVMSAEALANAYQRLLAKIASTRGLPVTKMDLEGYFMKFSDNNIIKAYYIDDLANTHKKSVEDIKSLLGIDKKDEKDEKAKTPPGEIEKLILKTSIVADVGGFLYTDKLLKRTSAIRFAYLTPAIDAVEAGAASVSPQMHIRYTPEAKEGEQTLFYIEGSSALYVLTAQLLVSDIGRTFYAPEPDKDLEAERPYRIDAAIDALIALADGLLFGAKRSRYMPQWLVRSMVISVSKGIIEFNVSPGVTSDYIARTCERASHLTDVIPDLEIDIYAFNEETKDVGKCINYEKQNGQGNQRIRFQRANSHTEALALAKKKIQEYLKDSAKGEGSGK